VHANLYAPDAPGAAAGEATAEPPEPEEAAASLAEAAPELDAWSASIITSGFFMSIIILTGLPELNWPNMLLIS